MANFSMLDAVFGYIDAHPEQHNQNVWGLSNSCGTTACVAGHAVMMAGMKLEWEDSLFNNGAKRLCLANGEDVPNAAARVLELTNEQAAELFYCFGTVDDLKKIVKNWANEQ